MTGRRTIRAGGERLSAPLHVRSALVCAGLVAVALAVGLASIATGDFSLTPDEIVNALLGRGAAGTSFIVWDLRLPRLLVGLLVGGALGAAGAIFQSLTRNPLGSPDIIGFTWGAAAAAVLAIIVTGGGQLATAGGALAGGTLTAAAVYLLALRGGDSGYRLILVGIGISAMLAALTALLIARAQLGSAQAARAWLAGTLDGRGWEYALPLGAALVVLAPLVAALVPRLAVIELGEDAARGLGVDVQRSRLAMLAVAVALTAVATAATGPIAFVALAAPQLARRLTRLSGPNVVAAALMGATLLVSGDLLSQRLFGSGQLPVGVTTGALGAVYLIWLLQRRWR
ncbi:MAG: iron chelate uptake ABC transporter family permease subunit [Solirubrobacteraceae bacterium]